METNFILFPYAKATVYAVFNHLWKQWKRISYNYVIK